MLKNITTEKVKGFKRRDLAKRFYKKGYTKGVEIGVCHGTYSKTLCHENPDLELKSVDPYGAVYNDYRSNRLEERGEYERLYDFASRVLKRYNCEIVRKTSLDASHDFASESIDFVYIDGSHEFDYVMTDLIIWGWKVRKGGIISGHDYIEGRFKVDIINAVQCYANRHGVKKIYLTDEKTPSWWFKRTW
jgi:hypothetical protein